ncbi:MAG: hypothetical protein QOI64_2119 [Solirubrobacteraceae bacterium]|nr:hypothetical protein [Solirubrobacteraceae bacterium]
MPNLATAAPHGRGDDLLDRERELAALDAAIADAVGGESALAVVEGPSGIGKSRLVASARVAGATAGLRTLSARAGELERDFPFGVVRQLFEPLLVDPEQRERLLDGPARPAGPVFDPLGAGAGDQPQDASFATLYGLYWLTANVAADGPLMLTVDDLHWADRASLRYLAYLVRRLETVPVLIVVGLRPAESGTDPALLGEVIADPAALAIHPGPLSRGAAGALVREHLGGEPAAEFVAACHESTGGNPLLLGQLLGSLAGDGVAPSAANAAVVREIGPRAIARTVLIRLARLPADATVVARAAAVLGEGADLRSIAALADLPEGRAAAAITTLSRAEILRGELPLGFVHTVVRDAIYKDLAPGERELQHARAAEILAAGAAPREQVAAHLIAAPRRGDAAVAEILRAAATAALGRGAPDSAIAYLRRALEEPPPAELRGHMLSELGEAEALVSGPTAVEHLRAAYEAIDAPDERARVGRILVRTLVFVAPPEETGATARRVLDDLPAGLDDERQALQAWELIAAYFGADDVDVAAKVDRYRDARVGTGLGAKALAAVVAWHGAMTCRPRAECDALAQEALADDVLLAEDAVFALHALIAVLMSDPARAVTLLEPASAYAKRQGSIFSEVGASLWTGVGALFMGDLDQAVQRLSASRDLLRVWTARETGASYLAGFLMDALRERGDLAGARAVLDASGPAQDSGDGACVWRHSRARVLLAEGRADEALAAADEYAQLVGHDDNPAWRPWRTLRAEVLHALGSTDEAVALAEDELELARRWGAPSVVGRGLRILGTLEGEHGIDHLHEAIDVLGASPARLEEAKALATLGVALQRDGRTAEARDALRGALEGADRCGAAALADAARAELTASGARPRAAATSGVDSLTASERRVVALAVEGRTNREIGEALYVTPKTVEVHLTNAYRKLGVRSRRELPRALEGAGDAA